ncbi:MULTISPECIES: phosphoglycerate dehydrogenase [Priestia]|mgnify:CR=1 FL=1|jgi:D-3-phosphoglycerate dehydrogenase / 2-oxoglutarate reductase|uniref:D-3-phosphoglycerate dehydrogenase n=3 Tax=Priestia TaxID=2800373 RepID=A0A0H4KE89_9BACI|nr:MULTISPECIES: phosphoglycerate dehydrogenase [Priestia]AKO92427.1 3-phosphoglycerate dehydrogenase [Priestia filamentosa]KAB2495313.1 phosphoglycerate dehydrogenase [Priestia endophytica]KYG28044.1 3-phosphoglycerate dehydrogenase [Priestia endophytica]MBG9813944.1 3-phosphoglycerate dehydrogenase [Priestia endophytica]MCM3537642.1 phosphoglycerate dehydrogenase [Priestia endophytica]
MTTTILETVKTIKTLNAIAQTGLNVFNQPNFKVDDESENPDAYVLRSFNMHEMELGNNVKAIARAGAGVNNIPVDKCTENGIVVFNTPGANANAVKELVLTSLMASSRNLFDGIRWTRTLEEEGEKIPKLVEAGKKQFVGKEAKGKTLGIIGLGAIGALVANDALDLDMDVIGFDPFISVNTAWNLSRNVQRAMTIEELFANSDYITVHVPLTDKTKGMFNKETFSIMKEGVHILNFSRGELVNEDDMRLALESGTVGKYITDFPNENVLKMNNVIPIPHLGASTKESEENCARMAAHQVKDFLETGNIKNSVNFPNAYIPYTGKNRVTAFHKNVPNMVGQITNAISSYNLNIADMVNRSRGDYAYTMIDIEGDVSDEIIPGLEAKIREIGGIVTTRII